MSYEMDAYTGDCYDGTACLVNKLNIRNAEKLKQAEAAITFAKASLLEQNPIEGNFDFEHYKAVHRFLFEDIFTWAGEVRTIDIAKRGTVFVPAKEIEELAARIFEQVKKEKCFCDYSKNKFIHRIVQFYCDTNMLHPFREGNGRCQRAFLTQLIRLSGHDISFSSVDKDELMIATIQAAHGVSDYLVSVFQNILIW